MDKKFKCEVCGNEMPSEGIFMFTSKDGVIIRGHESCVQKASAKYGLNENINVKQTNFLCG